MKSGTMTLYPACARMGIIVLYTHAQFKSAGTVYNTYHQGFGAVLFWDGSGSNIFFRAGAGSGSGGHLFFINCW